MTSRSPFCYVGGKSRWVGKILTWCDLSGVCPSLSGYEVVAPFVGGGSVELALAARGVRVHAADADIGLVCAWNLLLKDPGAAAKSLETFRRTETPMTKERANEIKVRYFDLLEVYNAQLFEPVRRNARRTGVILPPVSPRELGFAYLVANKITFNGILSLGRRKGVSSRAQTFPTPGFVRQVREFSAPNLSVGHEDYRDMLAAFPDAVAYCDPPYCLDYTRNDLYGPKDSPYHGAFDHDDLAKRLRRHKGHFALSYNDCERVRDLYSWARIVELEGRYHTNRSIGRLVKELLIMRGPDDRPVRRSPPPRVARRPKSEGVPRTTA